MKTELFKIVQMKHFFKIVNATENSISYSVKKPSIILIKNLYVNWLRFLLSKTQNKEIPIFLNKFPDQFLHTKPYFGFIKGKFPLYDEKMIQILELVNLDPEYHSVCEFNLILPNTDIMQNFIQWQRYRKYWWSSITTTPSLFTVNNVNYDDMRANADIIAQFSWGSQPVERIKIITNHTTKNTSHMCCSMSLEHALFILLLDGLNNNSKEYLRLHRKIAPFKMSFALNYKDMNNMRHMCDLANLLYQKLDSKNILAWLPDFTIAYSSQIRENFHMGVPYTAILEESTLQNGILYLLNCSTMLKEEVHVSDFDEYAVTLFKS